MGGRGIMPPNRDLRLNPDGSIDQLKMKAVSEETDFSFDFHDLLLRPKLR